MTKPAIFNLDYNASFEMYDESCNNISRYKCPHWQKREDTIFMQIYATKRILVQDN